MSTSMFNVRDHLLEDHRNLESLLDALLEAFQADDRRGMCAVGPASSASSWHT